MGEPLGDRVINILIIAFASTFVLGWIFLLTIMLLEWIFPKIEYELEHFLKRISKPLSYVLKYTIIGAIVLSLIKQISYWLGW